MANIHETKMEELDLNSENIVFVDGITRSGKFWLGNMLMYLSRMEHIQHYPVIDAYVHMNHLGVLEDNVTVSLLQNEVSTRMYEMAIGRNVNFRRADSSSIYKNPNLQKYLQRVEAEDVNPRIVEKQIKEGDRIFQFIVHDWLCTPDICFRAFPKMKMIFIERNPIDLVYAWYKKGHGDKNAFSWRVESVAGPVPWFINDWAEEYDSLSEMDRIIKSVISLINMGNESFKNLSDSLKKRILFTSYELLADNPREEAEKTAEFLGAEVIPEISMFVNQDVFSERNKKTLDDNRNGKMNEIKEIASEGMGALLQKTADRYEKKNSFGCEITK